MATLTRDVERPAFLDRPSEGQLSLGGAVAAPGREGRPGRERESLSERLRRERAADARTPVVPAVQAGMARGGGATLDDVLVGAWEGLSARRPVTCPVCASEMLPRDGAAGGACGSCGSQVR